MLELVPISLKEANAYVERYHRHHKPVVGHKFSIAAAVDGEIVGVAIVGRPVSRYLDDGWTLEVNRLCTNGYRNACSFLYSAAWRAARNLGYKKLITYILESESGTIGTILFLPASVFKPPSMVPVSRSIFATFKIANS